ncbi:hypothetical protein MP228_013144 [Amoeboaphelidium protococcarum]|nr:hypothetical protein MP228_013144 [Amoeboaphelidium protococcarum]
MAEVLSQIQQLLSVGKESQEQLQQQQQELGNEMDSRYQSPSPSLCNNNNERKQSFAESLATNVSDHSAQSSSISSTSSSQQQQQQYSHTTQRRRLVKHLGLHSSASQGDLGQVKLVVETCQSQRSASELKGIIDSRNRHGMTALHGACYHGHIQVAEYLIDSGADVNCIGWVKNKSTSQIYDKGPTALHFACVNGHTPIVRLLLSHGAEWNVKDHRGCLPVDIARLHGHQRAEKLIQKVMDTGAIPEDESENESEQQVDLSVYNESYCSKNADTLGRRSFSHSISCPAALHHMSVIKLKEAFTDKLPTTLSLAFTKQVDSRRELARFITYNE